MARAALATIAIVFVVLATLAFWWLQATPWRALDFATGEAALKLTVWVVPALGLAMLLARLGPVAAWRGLGLSGAPWRGVLFGALATTPMLAAALWGQARWPPLDVLVADVAIGPFAEEVLFRGLLFLGLRRLGWAFWPAAALSSALFGLAHVEVFWRALLGGRLGELALYFLFTEPGGFVLQAALIGAGGLLFAWIAERWWSLWPAIGLHAAINFWSDVVWGEARVVTDFSPLGLLWAGASCASLVLAAALTQRFRVHRSAPAAPPVASLYSRRFSE